MNVLIFGAGSYIGEHYREALETRGHQLTMIDTIKVKPEDIDFSGIDTVINVAGIAHIKISSDMEDLFYKVNTHLAIDLCKEAKIHGVKHYIYMSSMNVYGDTSECICSRDQEKPKNFYGKSKWLADKGIHELESDCFKVASVRPPVVYSKGCKGNFVLLAKLSNLFFIFPSFKNTKSMIFIDNLCNFMCELVENGDGGYFHPQNAQHTNITEIIKEVRAAMGKKTLIIPGFGWAVKLLMKLSHKAHRAFADDYYSLEFSKYRDNTYCSIDFKKSIKKSIVEL
ncbi:MAG: NAD-dependent epimerase/dehydratase family protein [Bacteroidales bacterium]